MLKPIVQTKSLRTIRKSAVETILFLFANNIVYCFLLVVPQSYMNPNGILIKLLTCSNGDLRARNEMTAAKTLPDCLEQTAAPHLLELSQYTGRFLPTGL